MVSNWEVVTTTNGRLLHSRAASTGNAWSMMRARYIKRGNCPPISNPSDGVAVGRQYATPNVYSVILTWRRLVAIMVELLCQLVPGIRSWAAFAFPCLYFDISRRYAVVLSASLFLATNLRDVNVRWSATAGQLGARNSILVPRATDRLATHCCHAATTCIIAVNIYVRLHRC